MIPLSSATIPFITPLVIQLSVELPMRSGISVESNNGSFFVKVFKAIKRIFLPGEIIPPTKLPFSETKSYLMAVPRSIISMFSFGNKAIAPTDAANRSRPKVSGVA